MGVALIRRLVTLGPAAIRVLSRSAAGHTDLTRVIHGTKVPLELVAGDVADPSTVHDVMTGANVVFHLAAIKGVDVCEAHPYEAIKTNLVGSKILVDAATESGSVSHFVAVSSDKAVNPVDVYGTTKWLMERMVCDARSAHGPRFSVVRCGNFWGSSASVLSFWQRTIREGGAIRVTDPRMTRFVTLAPDGADLILSAAGRGLRGEILVRPMPVYVLGDLAAAFSERYGAKVLVVGPRVGEKLHDDLISEAEAPFTRREGDEFIITPGRAQQGAAPLSSEDGVRLTKEQIMRLLDMEGVSAA